MSDEEYISVEEFLANLRNIDNEKLIQSLQNCGHDGYYNDLYYPIIEEIKRRLSSTSAESERKKGQWSNYKDEHCCSICKCVVISDCWDDEIRYDYCPYCGAEME